MRIPDDLSPTDTLVREELASTLRTFRQARGITRRQVADALGVTAPVVHDLEGRITWTGRTIMRYARAVGYRIEWLIRDLVALDDDDVMAVILATADQSTPERADRVQWRILCYDLVRVRRATTTAATFGARLGIHENAVHYWEANPDGSSVIAAQRHARGLGGSLGWALHETPSPLTGRAPQPRRAA